MVPVVGTSTPAQNHHRKAQLVKFNDRRDLGWIQIFLDPDSSSFDGEICDNAREIIELAAEDCEQITISELARVLDIERNRCRRLLNALGLTLDKLRKKCAVTQKVRRGKVRNC